MSLDVLMDEFSAHLSECDCATLTVQAYTSDLRQFYAHLEAEYRCGRSLADETVIPRYLSFIEHNGYSNKTVRRKVSSVRRFYKWLHDTKQIATNPMVGIFGPDLIRTEPRRVAAWELGRLLDAIDDRTTSGARDRAILTVIAHNDVGVSELLACNLHDFRADESVLCVGEKMRDVSRDVSLTIHAAASVRHYLQLNNRLLRAGICLSLRPGPLFLNKNHTRLSERAVRRSVNRYARLAGLDHQIDPTTLRRFYTEGNHA